MAHQSLLCVCLGIAGIVLQLTAPIFFAACLSALLGLGIGELAPVTVITFVDARRSRP
jgi:hypothetical protein